jgi:hypothetical protein
MALRWNLLNGVELYDKTVASTIKRRQETGEYFCELKRKG